MRIAFGLHRHPLTQTLRSAVLGLCFVLMGASVVSAQSLIRDAEIESTLKRIAAPVFKAAGIGRNSIEILVVNDPSLNAFVANNRAIFLNSGLIMRLGTVAMLQSVIAHELAHITSGHLIRRAANRQSAMTAIGIGLLLSAAVSASGKANSAAAAGIALGTAGGAINTFLAHTRAEEQTADQIGTRYLVLAGIDPRASVKVLEIFKAQEALSVNRNQTFTRTHPLSEARIKALRQLVTIYAGRSKPQDPDIRYWYGRMQAKFRGFLGNPTRVLRRLKAGDMSQKARLTRAIAYHRLPNPRKAMAGINALLALRPDDAYYRELKGQFLLEDRKVPAAVAAYKSAVEVAPNQALILAGYGRALLALGTKSGNRRALAVLRRARDKDPRDDAMLRDLALAWAHEGNNGMASLVTAERYALLTRFKDAATNAQRAKGLLPRGSVGWQQAQDIIAAAKIATRK